MANGKQTYFRILSGSCLDARITGICHFLRGRTSTKTNQFTKEVEMNSNGYETE